MNEKAKKKNEIVIINKFKETGAENITTTLVKIFKTFCNMQITPK